MPRPSFSPSKLFLCLSGLLLTAAIAVGDDPTAPAATPPADYEPSAVEEPWVSDGGCDWLRCDAGCDGSAACPAERLVEGLFGGLGFAPSDSCYNDFISPITNIVHFEDPRTVTELRPIFIHNEVPNSAGGGDVQLIAMHVRAALNDRLSIVAAKDGFITSDNPLIEDGWADISIGLKYNVWKDPCEQWIVSAGFAYEMPTGSHRTLQGNGDGKFALYLTAGTEFADCWHYVTTSGFRLPANTNEESQVWYWSQHVDRKLTDNLYGLVELNWFHWMRSGQGGVAGVEGVDLWNFGSTGVAGNDIVTMAVGTKLKPTPKQEVGLAYEFPLTNREDILDHRIYVDWIVRY